MSKVIVGMSGGVDSAVAALLLKEQGYDVVGVFMKNWDEKDGPCPAEKDYNDVVDVCRMLDIPCYSVNFSQHYWDRVFARFLEEIKAGYTPNPDIWCNQEIKFKVFLEKALELEADYIATGHYCRNIDNNLGRGLDQNKDQSYFLYTITSDILQKVLFPVGELKKDEVKKIAKEHGLEVYAKKESMGICFIGKRNFKEFLSEYIEFSPGNMETEEGRVVGRHDGIPFYTIGQRKGLGIGGAGEPWFVLGKDIERNVVIVGQGENHPSLFSKQLTASSVTWVSDPVEAPFRCTAKVRYRQEDVSCTILKASLDSITVEFDDPCRAVTLGQSVVFYSGELCLGGAIIRSVIA